MLEGGEPIQAGESGAERDAEGPERVWRILGDDDVVRNRASQRRPNAAESDREDRGPTPVSQHRREGARPQRNEYNVANEGEPENGLRQSRIVARFARLSTWVLTDRKSREAAASQASGETPARR